MKNIVLGLISLLSVTVYAGNTNDLMVDIERRTLVVVLETTVKAKYDKLDIDGKEAYARAVENYNRKIKEVAGGFWSVNKNVEYKTWDEVDAIVKDGDNSKLLLYAGNYSVAPSQLGMMQKGLKYYPNIFSDNENREYIDYYTSFKLCFVEDFKKDKYIVSRTITNLWPLKEDMIFAFQYLHCLLLETKATNVLMDASKVAGFYKASIAASTLLIKKELLPSTINIEVIDRVYPYKYKIVAADTLHKAIMQKADVAYIEIVPVMIGTGEAVRLGYEHVVMNAKAGVVVAYIPVNYGVLHATMGHGTIQKYLSTGALQKYAGVRNAIAPDEPE